MKAIRRYVVTSCWEREIAVEGAFETINDARAQMIDIFLEYHRDKGITAKDMGFKSLAAFMEKALSDDVNIEEPSYGIYTTSCWSNLDEDSFDLNIGVVDISLNLQEALTYTKELQLREDIADIVLQKDWANVPSVNVLSNEDFNKLCTSEKLLKEISEKVQKIEQTKINQDYSNEYWNIIDERVSNAINNIQQYIE